MSGWQAWIILSQRVLAWTLILWYPHQPTLWATLGLLLIIDAGIDLLLPALPRILAWDNPAECLALAQQCRVGQLITAGAIAITMTAHLKPLHHDPMALTSLFLLAALLRLMLTPTLTPSAPKSPLISSEKTPLLRQRRRLDGPGASSSLA